MRQVFIITFIFVLIFGGCSTKERIEPVFEQNASLITDDDFEEFEDEEYKIEEKSDPLGGYNRVMTSFNDKFYIYVFDPVARGYKWVVPKGGRESIRNFFHNLFYPVRLVNNLLQGKIKNSAEETGRFVINTTVGILGLFDPAKSYFGLESHEEDFGQTLGYYGVGSGYHIVLPFLGPSNMRDMFALYPDTLVNPVYYQDNRAYNFVKNNKETYISVVLEKVNSESFHIGRYQNLKKDSIDLYPFLRNIYEQHREKLIKE